MRTPSSSSANEKKSSSSGGGGGGKMVVLKRGPWTADEDELLTKCINREGEGKWRTLPIRAGLARCGKSCRLRWMNYLRPSVKRGQIAPDEEDLILRLHRLLGNRWSLIAGRIPGRTDNEIKNYWNTHLSKKLISQGIDPKTHKPLLETSTATYSKQLAGSKDGKKIDSNNDNSGTSNIVTTTGTSPTSSGQNPNIHSQQYNSASVTDGFEEEDGQMVHGGFGDHASDGNEAGCYSDGYHRSNVDLDDAVGGYHVNLQQGPSQGVSNEFDGGSDGMNCEEMVEDDGVFSSFLNSLINDDMFV
ncbi:unnamed protein product [Rhodiola kirilowii]